MSEKDEFQSILEKAKASVAKLNQPTTFSGLSNRVEEFIEAAYWEFDARQKGYGEFKGYHQSERDAFKWAVRALFKKIRRTQDA